MLDIDGKIKAWGDSIITVGVPKDPGWVSISSTAYAFAALGTTGCIAAWGDPSFGGSNSPTGCGYTAIYSSDDAFGEQTSVAQLWLCVFGEGGRVVRVVVWWCGGVVVVG